MTITDTLRNSWGFEPVALVCENCDWSYLSTDANAGLCPHCSKAKLQAFELDDSNLPSIASPELMLGYRIGQEQMNRIALQFIKQIPFPPHDLTAGNMGERVQRVFIPMWLVDAQVNANWEAQAGYDYQVESHKSNYSNGQWRTQKVYETRMDWEDRAGQLMRQYDNISAPALEVHQRLIQKLGRYAINDAEQYSKDALRRALIRLPDRSTEDAFSEAQENFRLRAADDVKKATDAKNIRHFQWQAKYDNVHWTQLLLPVFMTYYADDSGKRRVVYINGATGQVSGERRGSMKRAQRLMMTGLTITAVMVAIAIGIMLFNPDYDDAVAIVAIIAAIAGIGSLIPVIHVWQFNSREERSSDSL